MAPTDLRQRGEVTPAEGLAQPRVAEFQLLPARLKPAALRPRAAGYPAQAADRRAPHGSNRF